MEKNYYKILEIDRDASPEIVEKAYKTLVMKYHPDLQKDSLKLEYEEKLKLINEAYDILSNDEKRKDYDAEFQQKESNSQQIINDLFNENQILKEELNNTKQNNNYSSTHNYNSNEYYSSNSTSSNIRNNNNNNNLNYEKELNRSVKKAYHDAYIQDLKNRGYKIRYKKTLKEHLKDFVAIAITITILFLIFQIPFIKNFFVKLYEENNIIHIFVDLIIGIFQ